MRLDLRSIRTIASERLQKPKLFLKRGCERRFRNLKPPPRLNKGEHRSAEEDCPKLSGQDRHLNYAVSPFAEQLVGLGNSVESEAVRQQGPQIEAAVTHQFHQPAHPFLA